MALSGILGLFLFLDFLVNAYFSFALPIPKKVGVSRKDTVCFISLSGYINRSNITYSIINNLYVIVIHIFFQGKFWICSMMTIFLKLSHTFYHVFLVEKEMLIGQYTTVLQNKCEK